MDKLKLAHDWFISSINNGKHVTIEQAWCYADAMQAEAEKRKPSGLPESLCEVDWNQAPEEYPVTGWYIFMGVAHWISDDFPCGPAPSFGFTGTHIMERPNGF